MSAEVFLLFNNKLGPEMLENLTYYVTLNMYT